MQKQSCIVSGGAAAAEHCSVNAHILVTRRDRNSQSGTCTPREFTHCKRMCKLCRTAYNALRYHSAGENAPQALEF